MTYELALQFLYEQLPMFQRQGQVAFKKTLDNINILLAAIGDPQDQFKSIHIAGTNGKGTTTHMIAGALQANGYKTGIYCSPHYKDFRERIKIDGQFVDKSSVVNFIAKNRNTIDTVKPSFFELTVAMAFQYFADQKVDIAVIETGLGGRLDSTNVIHPLISIITNISLDHQALLGNTLKEIAIEKAGIIKPHAPVVIGEHQKEVGDIFIEAAHRNNSKIHFASEESSLLGVESISFHVSKQEIYKNITLKVDNEIQRKNLATSLFALYLLRNKIELLPSKISEGISRFSELTYYIGRYQILGESPTIIADSAHNKAGLKALFPEVQKARFKQLHIVMGFVHDKEVESVLSLFPKEAIYYLCKADIPRGLPADELQLIADSHGIHGDTYESVISAFNAAKANATPDDFILVCGSIFVVAEVL